MNINRFRRGSRIPRRFRLGAQLRSRGQGAGTAGGYQARVGFAAYHRGLVLGAAGKLRVGGGLLLATVVGQLVPEGRHSVDVPRDSQPGVRGLEREPDGQLHHRDGRQLRAGGRRAGAGQEQEGAEGHRRVLERLRQPHGPAGVRSVPGAGAVRRDLHPVLRQRVQRGRQNHHHRSVDDRSDRERPGEHRARAADPPAADRTFGYDSRPAGFTDAAGAGELRGSVAQRSRRRDSLLYQQGQ